MQSHEVVDGEVPRLRCIEFDDSPVVEVHVLVAEPDRQKCVGSPKKFNERLDSVDGATGNFGFEWFALVVDENINVVDGDVGGEVERDVGAVVAVDFAENETGEVHVLTCFIDCFLLGGCCDVVDE